MPDTAGAEVVPSAVAVIVVEVVAVPVFVVAARFVCTLD